MSSANGLVGTGFASRYRLVFKPIYQYELTKLIHRKTGPDGAVAISLANGLVGTGFASRYRLQPRAGFKRPSG